MNRLLKQYDSRAQTRVSKLDGRTRIVAVYRELQWERPPRGTRFTRTTVHALHDQGVRELELRRGFTRARVPVDWVR